MPGIAAINPTGQILTVLCQKIFGFAYWQNVMFSGELMFIKLFKWMQALIFGYLFFERVVLVLPDFRIVDLLLASVAFLLLAGYAAYLISDRLIFLVFSAILYFLYSLVVVWNTYLYPLVTVQEYLFASVIYAILGLPLLFQVFTKIKQNKQRERMQSTAPLL